MEKRTLIPQSCLGDAISIVTFKDREDPRLSSMYISTLSNHIYQWHRSWRGRLFFAWRALKGEEPADICLEMLEDIENFKKGFDEAYNYITEDK